MLIGMLSMAFGLYVFLPLIFPLLVVKLLGLYFFDIDITAILESWLIGLF